MLLSKSALQSCPCCFLCKKNSKNVHSIALIKITSYSQHFQAKHWKSEHKQIMFIGLFVCYQHLIINSGSLCVWPWQAHHDISLITVRNTHKRSSWCHQSSAYDLLQVWLETIKGTVESYRQGTYVINSNIIYSNKPSTFFPPDR